MLKIWLDWSKYNLKPLQSGVPQNNGGLTGRWPAVYVGWLIKLGPPPHWPVSAACQLCFSRRLPFLTVDPNCFSTFFPSRPTFTFLLCLSFTVFSLVFSFLWIFSVSEVLDLCVLFPRTMRKYTLLDRFIWWVFNVWVLNFRSHFLLICGHFIHALVQMYCLFLNSIIY